MAREPNRAGEMSVFVRVVEAGDFSGAARALGMSPSAVSKLVTRIEARLGTSLLRRSTRRLALTPEGEAFHSRALAILSDIETAEREAGGAATPAGRIRVNSSASYVTHALAPILPEFLARYPDVSLDIVQSDAVSDLVVDRTDVAIRAGPLRDSSLMARPLGSTDLVVAASPAWVERNGTPGTIDELADMDTLGFAYVRPVGGWLRSAADEPERVRVSDGEGIRQLVLAGVAPARLAAFTIRSDLAAGRLVQLLPAATGATQAFHAVYIGRSGTLPARVRVFLDHLAQRGMVS